MPAIRDKAGRFVKGASGNPRGRAKIPEDVREILRAATAEAARLLIDTMRDEEKDIRLRKDCAVEVLNRVYGKPTQPIDGNMIADIGLSEEDRRLLRKVEKRLA